MPIQVTGNAAVVAEMAQALLGGPLSNAAYTSQLTVLDNDAAHLAYYLNLATEFNFDRIPNSVLALNLVNNMLGADPVNTPAMQLALTALLEANPHNRGVVVYQLAQLLSTLEGTPVFGTAAKAWNQAVYASYLTSSTPGYAPAPPQHPGGKAYAGLDATPAQAQALPADPNHGIVALVGAAGFTPDLP